MSRPPTSIERQPVELPSRQAANKAAAWPTLEFIVIPDVLMSRCGKRRKNGRLV
jgi:hypothetical protein